MLVSTSVGFQLLLGFSKTVLFLEMAVCLSVRNEIDDIEDTEVLRHVKVQVIGVVELISVHALWIGKAGAFRDTAPCHCLQERRETTAIFC